MRSCLLALPMAALIAVAPASQASAEPQEEYLARLSAVCEVDCMKPRDFRRAARKRDKNDANDMAVIMDVVTVRRNGDRYELLSMNLRDDPLVELALLGSAGINTSYSNGVGGLPRSQQGGSHPELIVIEITEDALFDFLNTASPAVEGTIPTRAAAKAGEGIVVDGEREQEFEEPSLSALRTHFRNRRVVVRGQPRLTPALIGARLDFRRKQVTLEVDRAQDIVLLPRYDKDGEPMLFIKDSE